MQTAATGDDALFVEFFSRPKEIRFKSEQEGRPIFEDRDWIRIAPPGDPTTMIEREVREDDKARFRAVWERYKAGQEMVPDGTPIESWPRITRAQAEELRHMRCHTVEQLAHMSDTQCQRAGAGIMALRKEALAFLETAKNTAAAQRFAAENERLRQEIEDLKAQFAELASKRGKAA